MRTVEIQGIKVDIRIFKTYFVCDYAVCKGACCHTKLKGVELNVGRLTYLEAKEIQEKEDFLRTEITYKGKKPLFYTDIDGQYTTLINGVCVFADMKNNRCFLKDTHSQGGISFAIPMYCHLYPLDYQVVEGKPTLYMSELFKEQCKAAYKKGKKEQTLVFMFLKEPIIRMFGDSFYNRLLEYHRKM